MQWLLGPTNLSILGLHIFLADDCVAHTRGLHHAAYYRGCLVLPALRMVPLPLPAPPPTPGPRSGCLALYGLRQAPRFAWTRADTGGASGGGSQVSIWRGLCALGMAVMTYNEREQRA